MEQDNFSYAKRTKIFGIILFTIVVTLFLISFVNAAAWAGCTDDGSTIYCQNATFVGDGIRTTTRNVGIYSH